jgi:uracil-DNA glycosylase
MPSVIELEQISQQIQNCSLCRLCETRTNTVPGTGSPHADIVFIGEGPGKNEDDRGIPFCGASGTLLDTLLESISLSRSDVFITNIVKCRPPGNRDPLPDEKETCASTYLDRQLSLIQPSLIITLGRHALSHFIPNLSIGEVHGKPKRFKGTVYLPLYHPAAALYNSSLRTTLFQDFQIIPSLIKSITATKIA